MDYSHHLNSLDETAQFAQLIAQIIKPNFVISLNGDLGAGKTTLTRDILKSLGIVGSIKSPTFTLVEPYKIDGVDIYHFDLYRFSDPDEWFDAGFDEYFSAKYICFIEWASKANGLIPHVDWVVNLEIQSDLTRVINIKSQTFMGLECLKKLINSVED